MNQILSILRTDFYKQGHADQYDPSIEKLVSYYTPRMSRLKDINEVPVIGLQAFIKDVLIEDFNKNFFQRPLNEVIKEYEFVIESTMGKNCVSSKKVMNLHKLGYLPIEINALEEGSLCPVKCPMIEITNTHPDFAWCVNLIESIMSSELWYMGCTATAGRLYRNIVNKYYKLTSDNEQNAKHAISEFGFRGLPGQEAAVKASMGFLASFDKTATIPSILEINRWYGDDLSSIGSGMASTEHSVMCSSYELDGKNEQKMLHRLLTKIYPDGNVSIVCDSYDYWNVIENIIPKLYGVIMGRKGTLFVRGDSGDPVDITVKTVLKLSKIFAGETTINNKGYMVLPKQIRVIYGDSITHIRARKIYEQLQIAGFSAENVALGAGSFSMLCLEEEETDWEIGSGSVASKKEKTILQPFTRDTFGVAIKTTYGEQVIYHHCDHAENGFEKQINSFDIFKNPKTDTGNFKKSQKGCCIVFIDQNGKITYEDGKKYSEARNDDRNLLLPLFSNGNLLRETSFMSIRNKLWNNNF